MRPLRLELEGFSTFRERTVLDFRDLDLVALTGSTGAGKSTVIDAMTFALYGSVARYGNTGVVEPVIHQLSTEAKVRFDFEVGGQPYIATRVTRRQQQRSRGGDGSVGQPRSRRATTKEARLERVTQTKTDDSGDVEAVESDVLAGSVKELDAAVVDLLGLTFNQFTRTVVLPQGEFANFLRDEPTKRQDLLKRLLDLEVYGRMGSEARRRAEAADQQVTTLTHELSRLGAPDEARLEQLAKQAMALAGLRKQATDWLAEIDALDHVLEPLRGQAAQLQSDVDALAAIVVPDELETLSDAVATSEHEVTKALELAAEKSDALEAARLDIDRLGDRRNLMEIRQQLQQADDARLKLETLAGEIEQLEQRSGDAETARRRAEVRRDELTADLAAARLETDGAHLAAGLDVGDTCPVCRRAVDEVPDHSKTSTKVIVDIEASLAEVAAEIDRDGRAAAAATAELKSLETRQGELTTLTTPPSIAASAMADADDKSSPVTVAEVDQLLADLDRAAVGERELSDVVASAERSVARARADLERTRSQADKGRQEFGRQRDAVSHLDPPEAGFESLLNDWNALAAWASDRRATLASEREQLVADGRRMRTERDQLADQLVSTADGIGLAVNIDSVLGASELISVAEADLRAERQRADELVAHGKRLANDIEQRKAQQQVNKELGRHLSAKGFEAWLLAEAFDDITERATARLLELSAGRYSLAAVERDIAIVDHHNADEHRIARTLSGGETFLASLALALALADSIAALAPVDAPRLESMFLDEGFGTLDPETLDVVATAIEELAASGRMIGIVTHVRDLAERMPARFEIRKLPTGSTAELVTV